MSQEIFPSQLDYLLFKFRRSLTATTLLLILYCLAYLWFFVPYEDFTYAWRPDSQLVVIDVPVDSLANTHLQPGDLVLTIGGQPVRRMQPVYPLPVQEAYEYEVQRGDEVIETTVSFSTRITPLTIQLRLPATVLTLASWLVGAIILLLAKSDNDQALRAGSIFILGSVVVVGVQGSLNGVPGMWIAGYVLSFVLAPSWVYLGLIPRATQLSSKGRRIFKILFAIAGILALLAIIEVLYLFPQPTSFQELSGLSIYSLSLLLSGFGLLASVALLANRALNLPSSSYLRQQLQILLVFFGLGILPTVLLTFVPAAFINVPLMPFEVAISLMLFIPAGYLFVIYRRGFLGLDLFFSRSLHLILLTLIVFGFYAVALYFAQRLLNQNSAEAIIPATLVFLPTLLLAMYMNKPISDFVDRLVYGSVIYGQDVISGYTQTLTSRPALGTLKEIVESLAGTLSSTRAALVVKDETGRLTSVSVVGIDQPLKIDSPELLELNHPLVRSAESGSNIVEPLLRLFFWAEVLIPLKVRDEQIGMLALSRPGRDGYFNLKQVSFLTQAAGVLAVGTENIFLFDSMRRQSRLRLVAQEEVRKNVSRQLHDQPLQQITYAVAVVDQLLAKHFSNIEALETNATAMAEVALKLTVTGEYLRKSAVSLRNICRGLYPPFHDQGVDLAVSEILHQFETEQGLNISFTSTLNAASWPKSEQVTLTVSHVLTESLNNIVKHAKGADVEVKIEVTGEGQLILWVADNGPGNRTANLSFNELVKRGHLGIVGMHEWAQEIGGSLEILQNEPHGTGVLLTCPI